MTIQNRPTEDFSALGPSSIPCCAHVQLVKISNGAFAKHMYLVVKVPTTYLLLICSINFFHKFLFSDGAWGTWSDWATCSVTCDGYIGYPAHQTR